MKQSSFLCFICPHFNKNRGKRGLCTKNPEAQLKRFKCRILTRQEYEKLVPLDKWSRHGGKVTAIQSNSRLERFETLEDDYYFSRPVAADNWVGLEEWLEQEEEQTT